MVILILIGTLVIIGLLLWIFDGRKQHNGIAADDAQQPADNGDGEQPCCGLHLTCEKDSLQVSATDTVVYYEDEELDRFAGQDPSTYTDDDIEEFRDVLLTLKPEEIVGWGRSIQLRGITLPISVRDELLMIVAEARRSAQ
jgi:hypothetical protein